MRRPSPRTLLLALLVATLVGLFVWHGTLAPDPTENRLPGNDELVADQLESGDRVLVAGRVRTADGDAAVIRLASHRGATARVTGLGTAPAPGDDVWVYGTLGAAGANPDDAGAADQGGDAETNAGVNAADVEANGADYAVAARRSIVREPWEIAYMYAVSLLAAVWLLARFARGWRFDPDARAFVPRGDSGGGHRG